MRPVAALYRRFRWLLHELARFASVGAVAYVVQIATTNLFWAVFDLPSMVGQGLGALISMIVAFIGHRHWTFPHRARTGLHREYTLFFIMNGVGMLIQLLCVWVSVYVLGFDSQLANNISGNFIGVGLGTLFRYWSYKRWVFPEATGTASSGTSDTAEPEDPVHSG
ncbi:putative flippase GtrA [Lipingzhangella halophila]|uniref:Putative flippase GtrA n=1 Tax=Lipingzhangella halophila TaxID=1783352 RepID=A0A7W7RM21_9ACTN|nr:GtrA family protein [Lipingzhangella halophila]MBB4933956.1 putative flippase GtrA [Lipingzhangella halophila]